MRHEPSRHRSVRLVRVNAKRCAAPPWVDSSGRAARLSLTLRISPVSGDQPTPSQHPPSLPRPTEHPRQPPASFTRPSCPPLLMDAVAVHDDVQVVEANAPAVQLAAPAVPQSEEARRRRRRRRRR